MSISSLNSISTSENRSQTRILSELPTIKWHLQGNKQREARVFYRENDGLVERICNVYDRVTGKALGSNWKEQFSYDRCIHRSFVEDIDLTIFKDDTSKKYSLIAFVQGEQVEWDPASTWNVDYEMLKTHNPIVEKNSSNQLIFKGWEPKTETLPRDLEDPQAEIGMIREKDGTVEEITDVKPYEGENHNLDIQIISRTTISNNLITETEQVLKLFDNTIKSYIQEKPIEPLPSKNQNFCPKQETLAESIENLIPSVSFHSTEDEASPGTSLSMEISTSTTSTPLTVNTPVDRSTPFTSNFMRNLSRFRRGVEFWFKSIFHLLSSAKNWLLSFLR